MPEVKLPTVGRIVHFFLIDKDTTFTEDYSKLGCNRSINSDEPLPATVVQVFGYLHANMHVNSMCTNNLIVPKYSVPHKSEILDEDGNPTRSYWDYPVIK